MNMEDYEEDYHRWPTKRELRKKHSGGKHVPNKNEAKLLRKLMSQTGMSEKELREHKKYRKMLSGEQKKEGPGKTYQETVNNFVMKQVTRELKLAKEHPKTKAVFKVKLEEYFKDHILAKKRYYGGLF